MAEKRFPYMKWYARDWRGDGALRGCSFAARGLWADILTVIHDEGEPYGHLKINGTAPDSAKLGRMLGGSAREIDRLLGELEGAGVFSRTDDGTIYSRRMVRDKAKADADKENGKGGGNPKLTGQHNGGVNPPDKAQIPETRTIASKKDFALARFDEFWAAYPKKVKRGRAEKAWISALKTTDAETIIAGAQAFAPTRVGQDKTFTPYPASWINDKGWLDEGLVASSPPLTAEQAAEYQDRADRLKRRGKYAPEAA